MIHFFFILLRTFAENLLCRAGFTFACCLLAFPGVALGAEEGPWRWSEAAHLPDWISIAGEQRTRYETLDAQFRAGSSGSDQILSLRTLARAELLFGKSFKVKLELQDSRAELVDSGSPINAAIVNAAELLEANLVWTRNDLFASGSQSVLRAGRLTLDVGKRRFIARNRFRNVIQAYTGLDWQWTAKDGAQVRTLFALPVNRKPSSTADLLENDAAFDEETTDQILWGAFFATPRLPRDHKGEFYFYGFHEDDAASQQTRNRKLYTPGFRLYRPAKTGRFDYELETMIQFGTVRATASPSDTTDLDHFARYHHVEAGYSFAAPWSPRLFFEYDYTSGDDDPNDGNNERFENLFAPNVADFGPTSIHTAFVRSNISSPGARLQIRPNRKISAYLSYRAYWLASDTDGWQGASGLRDAAGNSGSFLGHQLFLRGKWKVHSNVKLETGLAYRIDGEFQKNAPLSPRQGATVYSYLSTSLYF